MQPVMDHPALALTLIVAVGVGLQWLSWQLRLPAILLLLTAGPVTGWVDPEAIALFTLDPNDRLQLFAPEQALKPDEGWTLFALVAPEQPAGAPENSGPA